jgi:O-antigen/teichoic acid export membrane protein
LQWPSGAYSSGLFGLQRHGVANALQVSGALLRNVGAASVVLWVSPTVTAFFFCQAVASGAVTVVTIFVVHRCLPGRRLVGEVSWTVIAQNWRFSAGISVLTLVSIPLMQGDKFIVGGLLPLKDVGYYSLAWTLGNALMMLVGPIFVSVYPRMAQLAKKAIADSVRDLYRAASQLVSVILFPASIVLLLYARPVLLAWTRDPAMADGTYRIVRVIVVGTALYGLMFVPLALQLAYGWTTLAIRSNAIAVAVFIPLTYVLTKKFGCVGAAGAWVALNIGYVLIQVPLIHKRLLPGVTKSWYLWDVSVPFVGALLPALLVYRLVPTPVRRMSTAGTVAVAGIAALIGATVCSRTVRLRVVAIISRMLKARHSGLGIH